MKTIERLESEVRSYCRSFPTVFARAKGSYLYDCDGRKYLDFFCGAGVLNYGHNNDRLKRKLMEYIEEDGLTHSLDMATCAKVELLERFESVILEPRNMKYKVQFTGPTGTNAVESALKLARKVTQRHKILCFTNSFHGMTLGSLAVSGNFLKREGAGLVLTHSICMPYCDYFGDEIDTIEYADRLLSDTGSGVDLPAAAIVETVQAEGGVNVARFEWLRELEELCRRYSMMLIVDDIQVGCGRTGPFFSFEEVGIEPDMICLSKSLSGYGLPLAVTLIKPELDCWLPGEHNGTFRGHNLAFVTATEALAYWESDSLRQETERKGRKLRGFLEDLAAQHPETGAEVRGRGLIQGIQFASEDLASSVSRAAFERGLLAETSGSDSSVLKFLPPLTIKDSELETGLEIIEDSLSHVLSDRTDLAAAAGVS